MLKRFDKNRHLRSNRKIVTRKSYPANSNVVSTLPRSGKQENVRIPYKISCEVPYKIIVGD